MRRTIGPPAPSNIRSDPGPPAMSGRTQPPGDRECPSAPATTPNGTKSTERPPNQLVVRRLMLEVWGGNNPGALYELVAESYVEHQSVGDLYGPDGARLTVESYRRAIPDIVVSLDDLFSFGDRVARRFSLIGTHDGHFHGHRGTGNRVTLPGIAIDRLEHGLIVESWVSVDDLPLREPSAFPPTGERTEHADACDRRQPVQTDS